jgi:hypothetical protein
MKPLPPPRPAVDPFPHLYHQLAYTLMKLLPPPLDDSPEALRDRNHTAITKVAALLPVGASEADLAAQCIAARALAEEMLRSIRQHAGDIGLMMKLNAQYGSMVRASLSVLGKLMRVQAVRQKRAAIEGAATEDAWTQHAAERSMRKVVDPGATPHQAVRPSAAPASRSHPDAERRGWRAFARHDDCNSRQDDNNPRQDDGDCGAPVASGDRRTEEGVSKIGTNSHSVGFETRMSEQPRNPGARGWGETGLPKVMREAMAGSILSDRLSGGGNCLRTVAKVPGAG